MIRTQIQLTEEQAEKAKRLAAERGVSMAEVIRELIDRAPERDDRAERFARALAAVKRGGFRDREGKTDVSVRHDEYLAEALEQDLRKR
ncbi:MAG: ribbon-helix-helix domain-containing protein [Actinomycetota bacterium]